MGPVVSIGITAREIDELAGAKCAETEPELFYPASNAKIQYEEAATVCFTCPAKDACLKGARDRGEPWGVWGGVNFEKDPSAEPFDPTLRPHCGTPGGARRHRNRGQEVCDECAIAAADAETARIEARAARRLERAS